MNASRKRDVHACLLLLPLLKAAWLCLASIIVISKHTSSKSEHLYIHVEHISLTAVSHFCNDPDGFLQLSHKVSLVGRHGRRYSQSTLCSLQDALGLAQGDLPTPWEHSCSEAAMRNFTGKAQSWHKPVTHKWTRYPQPVPTSACPDPLSARCGSWISPLALCLQKTLVIGAQLCTTKSVSRIEHRHWQLQQRRQREDKVTYLTK